MANHSDFELYLVSTIIAYLLGSIPSGILIAKFNRLNDPRSIGSGNIGASNMTRVGGKLIGLYTLLGDSCKSIVPTTFALFYFKDAKLASVIALATVMGHCYSVFLKFSGGKGVATAAGTLFILAPLNTAIGLIIWLISFSLNKITSISAFFALIAIFISFFFFPVDFHVIIAFVFISLIIIRKHEKNLLAILNNSERKF